MSTLKELLEGHELPVKVVLKNFVARNELDDCYLKITHANKSVCLGTWFDKKSNQEIEDSSFNINYLSDWELYEEPKKKVKVALYAYKNESSKYWMVTNHFFKDNNEFNDKHYSNKFKRLDWSEIEVNDE